MSYCFRKSFALYVLEVVPIPIHVLIPTVNEVVYPKILFFGGTGTESMVGEKVACLGNSN